MKIPSIFLNIISSFRYYEMYLVKRNDFKHKFGLFKILWNTLAISQIDKFLLVPNFRSHYLKNPKYKTTGDQTCK